MASSHTNCLTPPKGCAFLFQFIANTNKYSYLFKASSVVILCNIIISLNNTFPISYYKCSQMSLRDLIHPHLCDCRRQSKSPSSQCRGPRRRPRRTIQKLPSKTKRALSMAIAYGKDLPPVNRSTSFSSSSPCCMLPVERRLNYNAMATQIQTCWRGY